MPTTTASFAANHAAPLETPNLCDILAGRENLLLAEQESEGSRFLFALSIDAPAERLAAETAALADTLGFLVEEERGGWNAIEPLPALWATTPGAHRRWSANISRFDDECDGDEVFEINCIDVDNLEQIASMQGYEGWCVKTELSTGVPRITFFRDHHSLKPK
jgi:hypothetical protein